MQLQLARLMGVLVVNKRTMHANHRMIIECICKKWDINDISGDVETYSSPRPVR